jgi:hypothetical protein
MKNKERIELLKRRIADALNTALNELSSKSKKRLLLINAGILTSLCIWLLLSPFHNEGSSINIFQQWRPSTPIVPPEPVISKEDINMLRDFKQMMDSLKIYDVTTYTEILQGREGLLDSVETLLRWYE